jgi:hypothetical protein
MMAIALAADLVILGSVSGIGPRQVSLALSGFAVLLAGVVLILSVNWRHIGEWLLVVLATISVAFAADLLVINGLPEFGAKHIVLASIGLGFLSTGIIPVSSAGWRSIGSWTHLITLEKVEIRKFLMIAAQLGLLVLVVRQYHLENQAVYENLMLMTFYGFLFHYFLPVRYRLPFFLFLSLAAIVDILEFANGD